jgi:hypothetical protein
LGELQARTAGETALAPGDMIWATPETGREHRFA